jgi:HAD superfamily hydrolase (TIGR01509 family)
VSVTKFDLIIFDCDGVLVDSEPILNRAHAEILGELGFGIAPQELIARFCGTPDAEMLATIQQEWGRPLPSDYEDRVAGLIDRACATELTAIPWVDQTIRDLDVRLCVASSGVPARVRHSLRTVGLLHHFEPNIFSATQVERGKPEPDLFLYAAKEMGVHPSRCLVIEDSIAGVKAAVSAAMAVIGYCGGGHCPPDHDLMLLGVGAATTIRDMRDLGKCVEKLNHK